MNDRKKLEELITIVREDSSKAIGCTEPVAIAYCANVASRYIDKGKIENIEVKLSKNIYKNAKAVKIPKTGRSSIELAVALGVYLDPVDDPMLVFEGVAADAVTDCQQMIESGIIDVKVVDNVPDVYINTTITADKTVEAIVSHSHRHLSKLTVDEEILVDNKCACGKIEGEYNIKSLSFTELKEIVDEANYDDIKFVLEGVDINIKAAQEGLSGYGIKLGKTLNELYQKSGTEEDVLNQARYLTAAAADMRMGGGELPVMTSGGSGNQGIGVILPIYVVSVEKDVEEERLARALFFAHSINRYVKEYSGKLSGMCGCGIASSVGSTAGIVYMLGGSPRQIAGACSNIYANLTGMICDGAKEGCSLKLSTSAVESIITAYLALNDIIVDENVGVISDSIESTIENIGVLAAKGFRAVDDTLVDMI